MSIIKIQAPQYKNIFILYHIARIAFCKDAKNFIGIFDIKTGKS